MTKLEIGSNAAWLCVCGDCFYYLKSSSECIRKYQGKGTTHRAGSMWVASNNPACPKIVVIQDVRVI